MWSAVTCPAIAMAVCDAQQKEKRMNALQLTTIAALPGSGAGCQSALPAEVTRWEDLIFPTIDYESAEAEDIDAKANRLLAAVQRAY